jgi:hypothetical protein
MIILLLVLYFINTQQAKEEATIKNNSTKHNINSIHQIPQFTKEAFSIYHLTKKRN